MACFGRGKTIYTIWDKLNRKKNRLLFILNSHVTGHPTLDLITRIGAPVFGRWGAECAFIIHVHLNCTQCSKKTGLYISLPSEYASCV